ncbi:MAG: DNA-methyltransferase [Promethearchaeota archaeon]
METIHKVYYKNSNNMIDLEDNSIDLIITSPPYPMIEMWDPMFSSLNIEIKEALEKKEGRKAFHLMHKELEQTWKECIRVLKPGGIICINIGDATRKINKTFQLFTNHINIAKFFQENNFITLPCILWRKPTNSPTKFLGSGMLPPNAYVTLEHEYILIFKKGNNKRQFKPKSEHRYNSAYFWEERNIWFSDIWMDIRGTSQNINNNGNNRKIRDRSAAYPLELPYRLINMFSIYGDTILDPFWGTGTTSLAAIISARNSIGYEINPEFKRSFENRFQKIKEITNSYLYNRIQNHISFIKKYIKEGKEPKYKANNYDFPVITQQERKILFYTIKDTKIDQDIYTVIHKKFKINSTFIKEKKLIQSRLILKL